LLISNIAESDPASQLYQNDVAVKLITHVFQDTFFTLIFCEFCVLQEFTKQFLNVSFSSHSQQFSLEHAIAKVRFSMIPISGIVTFAESQGIVGSVPN